MANAEQNEVKAPKFLNVTEKDGVLTFALGNGKSIVFDPAKANDEMRRQAMLHGFNQKIRDSAAGNSKTNDFAGALTSMQAVVDGILAGEWNRKGGQSGVFIEDLSHAIAEVKKVPLEKATAAVEKATPDQRKEWAGNAKVKAIIAKRVADRAKAAAKDDAKDLEIDLG